MAKKVSVTGLRQRSEADRSVTSSSLMEEQSVIRRVNKAGGRGHGRRSEGWMEEEEEEEEGRAVRCEGGCRWR